jgi:GrpB-like predicted nucleotidyltransferase (UPF0157 family)
VLGLEHGLVRLADPSPLWGTLFTEEAARLRAALGPLERAVEHYGSTIVPGLMAKPILDILVGATAFGDAGPFAEALLPLGYEYAAHAGVPRHQVFGKGAPRTHLVHVVTYGGPEWGQALGFRDALRADARLAATYAELKAELAARYPHDRATYTDAKAVFIRRVLGETTAGGERPAAESE